MSDHDQKAESTQPPTSSSHADHATPESQITLGPWEAHDASVLANGVEFVMALCSPSIDYETAKANAEFIAAAPDTAAERDRLKATNAELLAALELTFSSLDNSLRSAGCSTAGFIANRKLMVTAQTQARAVIAKTKGGGS